MSLSPEGNDELDNEAKDLLAYNDDQSSVDNTETPGDHGSASDTIADGPDDDQRDGDNCSRSKSPMKGKKKRSSLLSPASPEEKQDTHQEHPKISKLLLLPQELFDEITSYLAPANIVVLALVNKELMKRFMLTNFPSTADDPAVPAASSSSSLPPPPSSGWDISKGWKALDAYIKNAETPKTKARGSLLSLLDYDLLDLVYCYKCKTMHDPFVTFKDRAYTPWKASRCADWAPDHHMPPRATRKLLRTITKRRMNSAEYKHLLQQVNNTVTTYQSGMLSQTTLRFRYRDNLQLLRRQQVVSSIDKTPLALWLFRQQLLDPTPSSTTSLTLPKVYKICNHLSWDQKYGPLLDQLTHPFCNGEHFGIDNPRHTPGCFEPGHLDVSKRPEHMIAERLKVVSFAIKGRSTDVPMLLGNVVGCDKCTTDFSLDVVPLPQPFGWGFVLTTWLDLGKIDFSSKWDSHRDIRPGRDLSRPPTEHGDICRRFEDLSCSEEFRPRIQKLNQQRMTNYGWGKRAASGKDRYISWSSGHQCDPATGKFTDPDPLDKADY